MNIDIILDKGLNNLSLNDFHNWYQSIALRNFDLEDIKLESTNSGPTIKLPIVKLGEYEMWVIRIKQYFQIQDYALWEVIENGDSWVSVPQTTQENGTSVTKMSIPVTAKEKTNKKNDVKARSLLLMALPNEHQLIFSQYPDAKSMSQLKQEFGGNKSLPRNLQKTLLKQQYENFSATSTKSLDSIFNRLQKIVKQIHEDDLEDNGFEVASSLLRCRAKRILIRGQGKRDFINAKILPVMHKSKVLDVFKELEFKGYGPKDIEKRVPNVVCDKKSDNSKENSEESLVEEQVSQDTSSFVKSTPKVDKEPFFPFY
ncbi:hypothetical protein Tco_0560755 [Tanacetum coccineum]